jgi:hypothetical protein
MGLACELDSYVLVAGSCERCNETSASVRDGEFLDSLIEYQILKKDPAP